MCTVSYDGSNRNKYTEQQIDHMLTKWVSNTHPIVTYSSINWRSSCYSNDHKMLLVMGADSNKMLYSIDGCASFKEIDVSFLRYTSITYSSSLGKFYMVASDYGKLFTSYYGNIEWTQTALPDPRKYSVIYWVDDMKSLFILVQNDSRVLCSRDGVTWINRNLPDSLDYSSMCYSPEHHLLIACAKNSNKIVYSRDGAIWESKASLPDSKSWNKIAYSPHLKTFVIVADDYNSCAVSSDGLNWDTASFGSNNKTIKDIIYNSGIGMFIAPVYNTDKFMYSTNGTTWKEGSFPGAEPHSHITYDPSSDTVCVFAKGENRYFTTTPPSASSISWNVRPFDATYKFGTAAYYGGDDNSIFMFCRDKPKVTKVTNGNSISSYDLTENPWVSADSNSIYCSVESLNRIFLLKSDDNQNPSLLAIQPNASNIKGRLSLPTRGQNNVIESYLGRIVWSEDLQKLFIPAKSFMITASYDTNTNTFNTKTIMYEKMFNDANWLSITAGCTSPTQYKYLTIATHYDTSNKYDSILITSTDGNTISARKLPQYVDYVNTLMYCEDRERFYGVTSNNTIITSVTGDDWEVIDIPIVGQHCKSMVYADAFGMFIILTNYGKILTSTDLVSWESSSISNLERVGSFISLNYIKKTRQLFMFIPTDPAPYELYIGSL